MMGGSTEYSRDFGNTRLGNDARNICFSTKRVITVSDVERGPTEKSLFFIFFSSHLLSSSTRGSSYPRRSSGQAVGTGVVPPPPSVRAFMSCGDIMFRARKYLTAQESGAKLRGTNVGYTWYVAI